jgi:hypothetical protein
LYSEEEIVGGHCDAGNEEVEQQRIETGRVGRRKAGEETGEERGRIRGCCKETGDYGREEGMGHPR